MQNTNIANFKSTLMKKRDKTEIIRKIYLATIIFLFFGLVFSKLAISLSQFILLGLWIYDRNFKTKLQRLKEDTPSLIFLSVYVFFLIGMIWSTDWNYGFHDLRVKLPILITPFVIATFKPITIKELNFLLLSFVIIIFAKTTESIIIIFSNQFVLSVGDISHKISHIRFSLMINLAIFSTINLLKQKYIRKKWQKRISYFLILWFIMILGIIQSMTGIVLLIILIIILSFSYFIKIKNKRIRYSFLFVFFLIPILVFIYLYNQISNFYDFKDPEFNKLELYTEQGNEYKHDTTNIYIENGYKVGYYFCEKELKQEWNKISTIKYDSVDINDYKIKFTLKRYLTSLGLPKDSVGVNLLTDKDVQNVQNSISNYKLTKLVSLNNRIYKIIWQFYVYKETENANAHSITQRIEFTKTAFHIIKKNLFFGVGTGDVNQAFITQYEIDNSKLKKNNRYRTHNQYITIIVALGIIGGVLCILALFLPFFINKKYKKYLPSVFFVIAMLSMLNEDSLETTVSISFFAIFYSLLILQKLKK